MKKNGDRGLRLLINNVDVIKEQIDAMLAFRDPNLRFCSGPSCSVSELVMSVGVGDDRYGISSLVFDSPRITR